MPLFSFSSLSCDVVGQGRHYQEQNYVFQIKISTYIGLYKNNDLYGIVLFLYYFVLSLHWQFLPEYKKGDQINVLAGKNFNYELKKSWSTMKKMLIHVYMLQHCLPHSLMFLVSKSICTTYPSNSFKTSMKTPPNK